MPDSPLFPEYRLWTTALHEGFVLRLQKRFQKGPSHLRCHHPVQHGMLGARAVSVPEFPEYQGRQMDAASTSGHGGGAVHLYPYFLGDSHVLLPDAGLPGKVREGDPAAMLAAHEGEPEAPVPPGTEFPAFDAAVHPKLRHRVPVAGALYADDLYPFFP